MVRVTFSLDDVTVAAIRRTAARLRKPQSQIVREAVADYAGRSDQLSAGERARLLGVLEGIRETGPTRPARAVDAELEAVRRDRRGSGRRHETR